LFQAVQANQVTLPLIQKLQNGEPVRALASP
jgi:hypothetical protein